MFTLREIIDLAVRIEKNGENVYRKAQKEVSDPMLSSMLLWLADDELEHEKWFTQFKNGMDETGEDPKLEKMAKAILGGVLGEQAFSLQDKDFSTIESVQNLLELYEDPVRLVGGIYEDVLVDGVVVEVEDAVGHLLVIYQHLLLLALHHVHLPVRHAL